MEEEKLIRVAIWAFAKGYSGDDIRYSDHMYGHEEQTDEVMAYLSELKDIGREAFYEKYKEQLSDKH